MINTRFCFRDFSGRLITSKNMSFVDATGAVISPTVGTPFIDARNRRCYVGQTFYDASGELIEPR